MPLKQYSTNELHQTTRATRAGHAARIAPAVPADERRPRRAGGRLQRLHVICRANQQPDEMHGATAPTRHQPAAHKAALRLRAPNTSPHAYPHKKRGETRAPLTARSVPAVECRSRRDVVGCSAREISRANQQPGEMHGATAPTHRPPVARGTTLALETPVNIRAEQKA